jgi:TPR repeat protein
MAVRSFRQGRSQLRLAVAAAAVVAIVASMEGAGTENVAPSEGQSFASGNVDAVLDRVRARMDAGDCRAEDVTALTGHAEAGHAMAQHDLGVAYDRGCGVARDQRLASQWLLKSAAGGEPRAMAAMAFRYADGVGIDRNPETAFGWAKRAAADGSPWGHWALFHAFKNGWSVEPDLSNANAELRKAAEGGLALAQTALGKLRLNGGDWPEAATWLRRAVEQGAPEAMRSLAYMHENGLSVPRDLKEAARLYEAALARGFGSKESLERVLRMLAREGGR